MKRKIHGMVADLLVLGLLTCPAFASSFPDVDEDAVYIEAVDYVSEMGIMIGDNYGNFNPDQTVTRAEMAAIVCRMVGEFDFDARSEDFPDVPVSHWANGYVSKAAELGIVNGYDNGNFGPGDKVTYEQAVTMVVRALGGESFAQGEGGYPYGYLSVAGDNGCLEGLTLDVGDDMSRKDVAILVYNFFSI